MQPPRLFRCAAVASIFLGLTRAGFCASIDWPEMRGPTADGHIASAHLPLHWSESENVAWKTEIPFLGWSTPVIANGKIWLTTATTDGRDFFVLSIDAATGKILVNKKLFHADNPESLGNDVNTYATPSPVIEPGRVYVHFGSYGTACLDTSSADVLWQRTDLRCRHFRGPSSSPVLFDNLLILTFDGVDLQYLAALDKTTGKTVWKTNRSAIWHDQDSDNARIRLGDLRKAHSTPILVTNAGQPMLLSAGAGACYAYNPRTGHELWTVRYSDWSASPRPIFSNGVAWFVSGNGLTELFGVKADGQGDVTASRVLWRLRTHIGKFSSPILVDGLIYDAASQSFLNCIDAATGRVVWTERLGGSYYASPLYADGRLYFFNEDGVATVLEPGRTCKILATNKLDEGLMACPAVSGDALILRTKTHLYRIETKTSLSGGN